MRFIRTKLADLSRRISRRRRDRFRSGYLSAISDISLRLQDHATSETADYVASRMPLVHPVRSWRSVHDVAVQSAELEGGLVLEFGVYSGTTTNYIASKTGWAIHAFDSFEGLPETWRAGYKKGKFSRCSLPDLADTVTLHVGWFDETLPKFVAGLKKDQRSICYLHIDSDLYSSAKSVFSYLGGLIVAGTVIVFDGYFNYPGWKEGEFKAFQEFVAENSVEYEYITYNHEHQQVAVKIVSRADTQQNTSSL